MTRLPSIAKLEKQIAEVAMAWIDRARLALLDSFPERKALELHQRFVGSFPITYQESVPTRRISRDFAAVAEIAAGTSREHYELDASGTSATFSLFLRDGSVPLYVSDPILENMGVRLLQEKSYDLEAGDSSIRIQDFIIESTHGESLESDDIALRFKECRRACRSVSRSVNGARSCISSRPNASRPV